MVKLPWTPDHQTGFGRSTAPPRSNPTGCLYCLCCGSACPQVAGNPCLSYIEHVVLPWCEKFEVERAEANGGNRCACACARLAQHLWLT